MKRTYHWLTGNKTAGKAHPTTEGCRAPFVRSLAKWCKDDLFNPAAVRPSSWDGVIVQEDEFSHLAAGGSHQHSTDYEADQIEATDKSGLSSPSEGGRPVSATRHSVASVNQQRTTAHCGLRRCAEGEGLALSPILTDNKRCLVAKEWGLVNGVKELQTTTNESQMLWHGMTQRFSLIWRSSWPQANFSEKSALTRTLTFALVFWIRGIPYLNLWTC